MCFQKLTCLPLIFLVNSKKHWFIMVSRNWCYRASFSGQSQWKIVFPHSLLFSDPKICCSVSSRQTIIFRGSRQGNVTGKKQVIYPFSPGLDLENLQVVFCLHTYLCTICYGQYCIIIHGFAWIINHLLLGVHKNPASNSPALARKTRRWPRIMQLPGTWRRWAARCRAVSDPWHLSRELMV